MPLAFTELAGIALGISDIVSEGKQGPKLGLGTLAIGVKFTDRCVML